MGMALAPNRPLNTLTFRIGQPSPSLGSARPYYLITRYLGGCAPSPSSFYMQSYEEYTNYATKIDVWPHFVDVWDSRETSRERARPDRPI